MKKRGEISGCRNGEKRLTVHGGSEKRTRRNAVRGTGSRERKRSGAVGGEKTSKKRNNVI